MSTEESKPAAPVAVETPAQSAAVMCEQCKVEIGSKGHELATDCRLVEGENPHGMTMGLLRKYKQHHQPIVLQHGMAKFGLAVLIGGSNQAFNHLLNSSGKFMHLRPPTKLLLANFDALIQQVLAAQNWELPEVMEVLKEIDKANMDSGPRIVTH